VYDSVGKDTFMGSLDCLRPRGMLVSFGNASGRPEPLDPALLAQRGSLFLTRPTLADYTATRDELLQSATALFAVIRAGAVKIEVRQRWPLAEAAQAHRALEGRQTTGASVLLP
jgi:NADPH2:quinone reductase